MQTDLSNVLAQTGVAINVVEQVMSGWAAISDDLGNLLTMVKPDILVANQYIASLNEKKIISKWKDLAEAGMCQKFSYIVVGDPILPIRQSPGIKERLRTIFGAPLSRRRPWLIWHASFVRRLVRRTEWGTKYGTEARNGGIISLSQVIEISLFVYYSRTRRRLFIHFMHDRELKRSASSFRVVNDSLLSWNRRRRSSSDEVVQNPKSS